MLTQRFGRYELLAELGRGGMAELWLARLVGVGGFAKVIAIKRILPHLCDDARFVEMFLVEGRVAALLSHPNICSVYELGEVDDRLFLAMEYLEGVSWEQFLTAVPRGDVSRLRLAAGVLAQACDGLHYAHELHGVVHRDVSPQNLFVTVDGMCKVLDFGVAKVMSEGSRTNTGLLKGKLPYMSPEQIQGEAVDPRADVFAAGVVLWEALTAQRLFSRDTDYLIAQAVVTMAIPAVSAHAPYGPAVDAVVARALDRDVDRRYPTIAALAEAVRDAAARFGGAATPAEIGGLVRSAFAATLAEAAQRVGEASGQPALAPAAASGGDRPTLEIALRRESVALARRARPWALAGAAVALAVAIAIAFEARSTPAPAPALAAVPVPAPPLPSAPPADASPAVRAPDAPDPPEIDLGSALDDAPRPHRSRHPAAHPAATERGFYSVDSKPYATIFIDGERRDQTPLFHVALAPGRHRVRAVLADGRQRTFAIEVEPGAEATSGTLTW